MTSESRLRAVLARVEDEHGDDGDDLEDGDDHAARLVGGVDPYGRERHDDENLNPRELAKLYRSQSSRHSNTTDRRTVW